jgi:putative ABC transport system permease protein
MNLGDQVRAALRALRANGLRAALTMLGVIIGVAAVISMVSIGTGAQAKINAQIDALGTNLLTVLPGRTRSGGIAGAAGSAGSLTVDDAQALETEVPAAAAVAPEISRGMQITYERQNTNTQVTGTTPEFTQIRKWEPGAGRFLLDLDDEDGAFVAVLGATTATNLFGATPVENVVGATVRINRLPFTVVGVMAPRGVSGPENRDDQIFVPLSTARYRLAGTSSLTRINVAARSSAQMDEATAQISAVLRERHQIPFGNDDDFSVRGQDDLLSASENVTGTFTLLLGGIAAVSLLVGGIGIMNIMLVSVTERTREIGIRKAVGATRGAILGQFLLEAVLLSVTGGLVGIGLGFLSARVVSAAAGWATLVTPTSVAMAFGFSACIGLFFGIYPARRAAHLNPIEALRYE